MLIFFWCPFLESHNPVREVAVIVISSVFSKTRTCYPLSGDLVSFIPAFLFLLFHPPDFLVLFSQIQKFL